MVTAGHDVGGLRGAAGAVEVGEDCAAEGRVRGRSGRGAESPSARWWNANEPSASAVIAPWPTSVITARPTGCWSASIAWPSRRSAPGPSAPSAPSGAVGAGARGAAAPGSARARAGGGDLVTCRGAAPSEEEEPGSGCHRRDRDEHEVLANPHVTRQVVAGFPSAQRILIRAGRDGAAAADGATGARAPRGGCRCGRSPAGAIRGRCRRARRSARRSPRARRGPRTRRRRR